MIEPKRKTQKSIYDLLNAETKPDFLYLKVYKGKENSLQKKELFKEKGEWIIEQKMKWRLLDCSCYGDYEGLCIVNKKKHANDMKVHEKTARTATKQVSNPT